MLQEVPPEISEMIFRHLRPHEIGEISNMFSIPSYMYAMSWKEALAYENRIRALIYVSKVLPPPKPLDLIRILEKAPEALRIRNLKCIFEHLSTTVLAASACGDLERIPEDVLRREARNLLQSGMGGRARSLIDLNPEWVTDEMPLKVYAESDLSVKELLRYFPSERWRGLGDGVKLRALQGKPFEEPKSLSFHDSRHLARTDGPYDLTLEASASYPTTEGNCWRISKGIPPRTIHPNLFSMKSPWEQIANLSYYHHTPEETCWSIGVNAFSHLDKSYYALLRDNLHDLQIGLSILLKLPARGGLESAWKFYENVLVHIIVTASLAGMHPIVDEWPPVVLNACAAEVMKDLDVENLVIVKPTTSTDPSLVRVCMSPRVSFRIHNRARMYIGYKKYILQSQGLRPPQRA